jgi:uncharacterized protein YbaR (Trm112 family)/ubiquinone/menaquinone biosynthesis C-methylase UbiE
MKNELINFLKCPVDSSMFKLYSIFKRNNEKANISETGVLFCKQCNRWFPIKEGIPSILPDALREHEEKTFLEKYKDDIPDEILYEGVPINLNSTGNSTEKMQHQHEDKKKNIEIKERDKRASSYDAHFTEYVAKTEIEMTLKSFTPGSNDIILDLGVGTGRFLMGYLNQCKEVIGIDFSFKSLLKTKINNQQYFDQNLSLLQVDISNLPFKNNSFDRAISTQVIQHLPSARLREDTIAGISHVLKEGAEFTCSTTNYSLQKRFYEMIGKEDYVKKEGRIMGGKVYCFNFRANELEKLFNKHFEVKEVYGILNWIPKISKNLGKYRRNLDYFIARTPLSKWLGDLLLIRTIKV